MADQLPATKLTLPTDDPHNIQATKYYIFNETGNIMMASTDETSTEIEQSVRDVFAEVSVFFAAMTRAITTTTNPKTDEPYSIYNYEALRKIIAGSGLFVQVTQEDLEHQTSSVGVTFSKELLEGLLGLATGAGAMSFAQGMIASIGQEGLRIGRDEQDTESSVANIVFVCEYLLGMPTISAIVVFINVHDHKDALEFGPCVRVDSEEFTWKLHKDTYLFVTPKFVRAYSDDLSSIASNTAFNDFVEYLRAILTETPQVTAVLEASGDDKAPEDLVPGDTYRIMGVNLGKVVSAKLGDSDVLNMPGKAEYSSVSITVKPDATHEGTALIALFNEDDQVIASTPEGYGIKKKK